MGARLEAPGDKKSGPKASKDDFEEILKTLIFLRFLNVFETWGCQWRSKGLPWRTHGRHFLAKVGHSGVHFRHHAFKSDFRLEKCSLCCGRWQGSAAELWPAEGGRQASRLSA